MATWRARQREPITGDWGWSPQWGLGAEPLVRGSGPPEAESLLAFVHPRETANLVFGGLSLRRKRTKTTINDVQRASV